MSQNRSKSQRRHPAEVTSDRLAEASERWAFEFTGEERDMIGRLRVALERIAENAMGKGKP